MDELEISGKRYISTKRAGKDHKYHADYIGQLIRAKKVEGQKVGRSWYVDADSLAAYLGTEVKHESGVRPPVMNMTPKPMAQVVKEVEAVAIDVAPEEISQTIAPEEGTSYIPVKITQPLEAERNVEEKIEDANPIFYRTAKEEREARGLRYIADEGPLLPRIHKPVIQQTTSPRQHAAASVWPPKPHPMPIQKEVPRAQPIQASYVYEERVLNPVAPVPKKAASKKTSRLALLARQAGVVLVLGGAVFLVAAALSTHLLLTQTIDGGQSANVSYSIK